MTQTSLRPRSPLTVPTIHDNDHGASSTHSPPVSTWSPDASSIASCEDMVDDELYIRRVFSFDEWEYNCPQHEIKSPLHREPISLSLDKNRYQDSLQTLIRLPAPRTKSPSLFQEIWQKKLEHEDHLGYHPNRSSSFTTVSTAPETPIPSADSAFRRITTPIPSAESAFRQFQQKHHVSPIDTATPSTAPWSPSIPRECSEGGSFVQIDLNDDSEEGMQQQGHDSWSIPEYVIVAHGMEEDEQEVEL